MLTGEAALVKSKLVLFCAAIFQFTNCQLSVGVKAKLYSVFSLSSYTEPFL